MNSTSGESPKDIAKLVTRFALLPLDAAAFGAEMVAQSTRSFQKMAERSVESLMGSIGEPDAETEYEE